MATASTPYPWLRQKAMKPRMLFWCSGSKETVSVCVLLLLRRLTLQYFGSRPLLYNSCIHPAAISKGPSRAPCRDISHTLSGPGTSILSSSTIGILNSLAEWIQGRTTHSLLPSRIRCPRQWVSPHPPSPPPQHPHTHPHVSASQRGEQGECWLHIALGLPVERWRSCTPPGSGKSGLTVEGWWLCTSPGSGKSGVIGSFLWWCFCIFLCLRLCWIAELYIFKMGDDFINSEEYLSFLHRRPGMGALYCASLVKKYVKGLRGSRPIPRIDEECSEAIAARWVAEAGVPALYATSAYFP